MKVIEIKSLRKSFAGKKVLEGASMTVPEMISHYQAPDFLVIT